MRADARWWRAAHGRIARRVDVQVFASDTDQRRTGAAAGSVVVPNTYPEPGEVGRIASPHPTIVFPGLLTYPPNEDAAVWMAEQILPRIRQDVPDLRLLLVGEPSDRVRSLAGIPGVEVTGRVPSTAPYLRSADLVLVPLRVGGGTRIKILEAFAYGVAVVATSIGAEGLGTKPGVHLEIADDAAGLAGHCLRLLTDPAARTRITAAARELYRREYLPERARAGVLAAVDLALAAGGRRAQGHG
jgi:glycosyltransferase involved in cell wall biosynthesis